MKMTYKNNLKELSFFFFLFTIYLRTFLLKKTNVDFFTHEKKHLKQIGKRVEKVEKISRY